MEVSFFNFLCMVFPYRNVHYRRRVHDFAIPHFLIKIVWGFCFSVPFDSSRYCYCVTLLLVFLMTSAKVVTGRAAGGVYLKGRDIDVVFFITELLCMNIMPLGTTRRLDIVMGCYACCLFWNNCCFVVSPKPEVMTLIIWLLSSETCK